MILFTKTQKPTKKLTDTVNEILSIDAQMKVLKAKADILKADLKSSIEATEHPASISTATFSVTYKGATSSAKIDTKKFKENDLATYKKYIKTSPVKSSISVKAKG